MAIRRIRNLFRIILTLILFVDIGKVQASEYYWWNGKEKINLDLIPNQIVDFVPEVDKISVPVSNSQMTKKPNIGNVRILKISSENYTKIIKAKTYQEHKFSPLFKQGSDIKALAGGVFITFKVNTLETLY